MQAGQYGGGDDGRGGIVPADLVLYLVILWMSSAGEVVVAVGAVRDGGGGGVVGLSLMTGQL